MQTAISPKSTSNIFGAPWLSGADIRRGFIDFFRSKGHIHIPSAPVVPQDDPTLLFTNAGMNQFKAALLGDNREGWRRVANSQKCIRVSGKHNDLDEVGRDTYHHTFFEMLGNWSFGDYYKKEAIAWAWELLTAVWKLPKDRLFATVYKTDDEAISIWQSETDLDPARILRFGEKENFWEMGEIGPCGPCTEIHFDLGDEATRGATFADPILGVNGKNARYIEIWNLVFMQFERVPGGDLKPLKFRNVDTGMGFERVASILQGTGNNYETDIFRPLIDAIADGSGVPYAGDAEGTAHRVIADHLRALCFAIADGATPGNEGRGYVLRRILRRASRFARNLGQRDPFLHRLVPALAANMGAAYPELIARQDYIARVIHAEEERFGKTLDQGLDRFAKVARQAKEKGLQTLDGGEVFTLYDTYGFPTDLTRLLAEEQGLALDEAGYQKHMEEQRERARGAAKFTAALAGDEGWRILAPGLDTEFVGYTSLTAEMPVLRYREEGDTVLLVAARTPFYAESGGQVGDTGLIQGHGVSLRVLDTVKLFDMVLHKCALIDGLLTPEALQKVVGSVDRHTREAAMRNHSATHLLHAALREVLGPHVQQQGSRVAPEGLRFDFTHFQPMTPEEIRRVEWRVNEKIQENLPVSQAVRGLEEAKTMGAMALFSEKYGDRVRVIQMGEFSLELCGGTHAAATGQIGFFKITSESSIASGVRRIEAVTGEGAWELVNKRFGDLEKIRSLINSKMDLLAEQTESILNEAKILQARAGWTNKFLWSNYATELLRAKGKSLNGILVVVASLKDPIITENTPLQNILDLVARGLLDPKQENRMEQLSNLLDGISGQLQNGIGVFTFAFEDTLTIFALVGKQAQTKIKAGDLIKELAPLAEARGGGRADRAQAGSKAVHKEALVLAEAEKILTRVLGEV